jgi:hypothetical protein
MLGNARQGKARQGFFVAGESNRIVTLRGNAGQGRAMQGLAMQCNAW